MEFYELNKITFFFSINFIFRLDFFVDRLSWHKGHCSVLHYEEPRMQLVIQLCLYALFIMRFYNIST